MIVEPAEGPFYKLRRQPSSVVKILKIAVPVAHRFYEDGAWYVHEDHLFDILRVAYKSGPIDYSALPDSVQIRIALEKRQWTHEPPEFEFHNASSVAESYAVLHLTPDAPVAILEAVWRTLAKQHHPDRGGDAEEFKKYSAAYQKIKESL